MDCIHPEIHIAGRETRLAHYNKGTGITIVAYDYTFDSDGNRTAVTEKNGVRRHLDL